MNQFYVAAYERTIEKIASGEMTKEAGLPEITAKVLASVRSHANKVTSPAKEKSLIEMIARSGDFMGTLGKRGH